MKKIILSLPALSFFYPIAKAGAQAATPTGTISINIPTPGNVPIQTNFGLIISRVFGLIMIIAAIAAFAYLIIAGLNWITSGGDKGKVEEAQKKIQAAIIGLFIVFVSWGIMTLIGSFLGFSFTNITIPTIAP